MRDISKDAKMEENCECGEECKEEKCQCGHDHSHNKINRRQIIGKANYPRNKKCSCGSGKKFKNCCLGKREEIIEIYNNLKIKK